MATTCRLLLSTPTTLYPLYLVVGLLLSGAFRKCGLGTDTHAMSDDCAHWFPDVGAAGAAVLAAIVIAGVRQRVPRFRAVVSASHDRDDVAELARHTYGGHDYICEQLPKWCA